MLSIRQSRWNGSVPGRQVLNTSSCSACPTKHRLLFCSYTLSSKHAIWVGQIRLRPIFPGRLTELWLTVLSHFYVQQRKQSTVFFFSLSPLYLDSVESEQIQHFSFHKCFFKSTNKHLHTIRIYLQSMAAEQPWMLKVHIHRSTHHQVTRYQLDVTPCTTSL
jgi:hypothetical protein